MNFSKNVKIPEPTPAAFTVAGYAMILLGIFEINSKPNLNSPSYHRPGPVTGWGFLVAGLLIVVPPIIRRFRK
jgi:hypothetical protein